MASDRALRLQARVASTLRFSGTTETPFALAQDWRFLVCFQLSNGQRVIDNESIERFFAVFSETEDEEGNKS